MKKLLCMLLFTVLLFPVWANAATIHFTDDIIHMPTWESSDAKDNYKDTIGRPDFTGGKLILDNNKLTGVSFDYFKKSGKMGDLFIDKDNNGYFDYVLNNKTDTIFEFADNVLSSKRGDNDYLYMISHAIPGTADYRNDHFVAINLNNVNKLFGLGKVKNLGSFEDSKIQTGNSSYSYIFDDFSHDLEVDGKFSIAFAPVCANDVVTAVVPLPGTFVLLACGIFGLVGVRRKTMGK